MLMYTPPAFREDDLQAIHALLRAANLATLVTATAHGLLATPLPFMLDEREGKSGVLYAHLARANAQWNTPAIGEAMVIFSGPDAYISPSWYAAKREHGKVVPTWNYLAVHAYGPLEFFEDDARLLEVVDRLTQLHERARQAPWAVTDAPDAYIRSQLKGIVGVRIPITRIEGKRKMSQNRSADDRAGVAEGLAQSENPGDRVVAGMIPRS